MAGKSAKVPDAWEDDWESQADTGQADEFPGGNGAPLTKKERLAQHAESNRKIWESAETPDQAPLQFQIATPPLAQPFKAPMTVLARKPAPRLVSRRDPVTGLASLTLQDDSDGEADDKKQETPEEVRARQQREREEKQRRYDEVRAKIFGDNSGATAAGRGKSNPSSGNTTPGTVTPPRSGDSGRRGRGRGRAGFRGGDRGNSAGGPPPATERPTSQSGDAGARLTGRERELYDPNYAPKPGFSMEKRANSGGGAPLSARSTTPREEEQAVRQPRGPNTGERGGFGGFARRGAQEG